MFDKEGEVSSITGEKLESDLEKGDLGTWRITSFIDTSKGEKDPFSKFKMMYGFIEVDKSYLDNLKNISNMYNGNAPIFNTHYKLEDDDKNILKIRELYPELPTNENDYELVLEGAGTPWKVNGRAVLRIILDKETSTKLTASMTFH